MSSNNITSKYSIHANPVLSFCFMVSFIMTVICLGIFYLYKKKLTYLIISIISSIISVGTILIIVYINNKKK